VRRHATTLARTGPRAAAGAEQRTDRPSPPTTRDRRPAYPTQRSGELVPPCRARSVHRTSWVRRYALAGVPGRGERGREAPDVRPARVPDTTGRDTTRPPPQSPAPPPPVRATNSYARAELVACTVRAGCGGTSSRGGLARAP